jgi:NAD-dependent deacetylase
MGNKKVIVFTGAGMSAESGIDTFRDSGGTWEKHDVMEVASPQGWKRNPELVLDFYNKRRKQLLQCEPNKAHKAIANAEDELNIEIEVITQNIDDLHERAGSSQVLHLHGELLKVRSSKDPKLVYDWREDVKLGDKCDKGSQLRPHVVWFGEAVPAIPLALEKISQADYMLIVGTSLQVYPAAGIVDALAEDAPLYYVDPNPQISNELIGREKKHIIEKPASEGVPIALAAIKKETANT